jgi:hypothetical protein
LIIEVDEEVGRRLDKLVETSTRYRNDNEVAAEIVRLYTVMIEQLEEHMTDFKRNQRQREIRKMKPRARDRASPPRGRVPAPQERLVQRA